MWLWRRPVATAQIQPLTWEPPYATGSGPRKGKKTKRPKKKDILTVSLEMKVEMTLEHV